MSDYNIPADDVMENVQATYDVWTDGDTELESTHYYSGAVWEFEDWQTDGSGATVGHYTVYAMFPYETETGFANDPQVLRFQARV